MNLTRGCSIVLLVGLLWGCSPPKGVYHAVRPGQTLYQISRTYGIEESYLARVNRIGDPTKIAVGQRVFIPGAVHTRTVPVTLPSRKETSSVRPPSKPVSNSKPASKKAAIKPGPARKNKKKKAVHSQPGTTVRVSQDTKSQAPTAKKGTFLWPVRGKIIKRFGGKGKNASKGIEISVAKGHTVNSAAAGKVIYSGNGISGYGNLVILQHDNSYYSVYGFNSRNVVTAGSFVSKGQKIALSGVPPSGGTPRLYFEVRYGKHPVNPIFYLP